MKSNTFQLNKVYSTPSHCLKDANYGNNSANFYSSLYDSHPQDCPWPKAMQMWKDCAKKHNEKHYIFYVPVKRTACYITFSINCSYEQRFRIKTDANGLEYVVIDELPLYAYDLSELSLGEATEKVLNSKAENAKKVAYINNVMHLEEYGHVYIKNEPGKNARKLTTIEELNAAFGV